MYTLLKYYVFVYKFMSVSCILYNIMTNLSCTQELFCDFVIRVGIEKASVVSCIQVTYVQTLVNLK